ncbi:hypothetical protein [Paenibacillus xylanexedens]|uniref:hypothetical protein n=1 Tax=Paenibacillus xylanexedens TaxID=528191 RepID=UPI0011A1F21D|nr:hypothetical protein [Paenibacillus xylanexedens]
MYVLNKIIDEVIDKADKSLVKFNTAGVPTDKKEKMAGKTFRVLQWLAVFAKAIPTALLILLATKSLFWAFVGFLVWRFIMAAQDILKFTRVKGMLGMAKFMYDRLREREIEQFEGSTELLSTYPKSRRVGTHPPHKKETE